VGVEMLIIACVGHAGIIRPVVSSMLRICGTKRSITG
jgi:hypothetical protein